MGKLEFVDTYVHFIDPFNPDFTYPTMHTHPLLGEHMKRLQGKRFDVHDYLDASSTSNLVAAVHADADAGGADPVKETAWVQQQADETGIPQAILGFANLASPDAEAVIDRHLEYRNVRGIRHRSPGHDYLVDPAFERGYRVLEQRGLPADLGVRPAGSMAKIRDLARRFPLVPVALNHCGLVLANGGNPHDPAFFDDWKQGLVTAAEADNVVCKIEGVPVFDHEWTVDSLRPWVLTVIEAFGPSRCMFGSHWPYDTLFSTYEALVDAYAEIIRDFSADEQADMFSRNALAFYRIDL
jgi:predicted TIM-barrel fold metal-dependent hydrolase